MIFFELKEILQCIFVFLLFGILMGTLYRFLYLILKFSHRLLYTFTVAHRMSLSWSLITLKNASKITDLQEFGTMAMHIFDFIYFTLCGVIYVVLQYIYSDGLFRFYSILICLISAYIAYRSIGNIIFKFGNTLLEKILFLIYFIISAALYPVLKLLKIIFETIKSAYKKIVQNIQKKITNRQKIKIKKQNN